MYKNKLFSFLGMAVLISTPAMADVYETVQIPASQDTTLIDDANGRRVTVECNYRGKNLRKSVSTACDAVGVPHHFREAELPKHLEVYRTKR